MTDCYACRLMEGLEPPSGWKNNTLRSIGESGRRDFGGFSGQEKAIIGQKAISVQSPREAGDRAENGISHSAHLRRCICWPRMGGNQKGFSAIGECGVGNLRRTDTRLLTATPPHLKGQKIADYMRRLGLR